MNIKNMSKQGDGKADITASLGARFQFMYIVQVSPKDGNSLTFVSAIN